jgi:DnaJ family protein B protein 4
MAQEQKTVHIKPGYHSGTVIHVEGGGHETVHRTASDLFFAVTELPHPHYERKGDDLVYTHELSLAEALECKAVEVVTLDGRHLNVGIDEIIT